MYGTQNIISDLTLEMLTVATVNVWRVYNGFQDRQGSSRNSLTITRIHSESLIPFIESKSADSYRVQYSSHTRSPVHTCVRVHVPPNCMIRRRRAIAIRSPRWPATRRCGRGGGISRDRQHQAGRAPSSAPPAASCAPTSWPPDPSRDRAGRAPRRSSRSRRNRRA